MEKRQEMIQAINDKFVELSTETILFHQALADILGFHITDHRCMYFLHRNGPMPAGRLSDLTGLTTAAVTSIIDRLEQAGYARRTSDPKDRRKTIVEPIQNKKLESKLETIFTPLHERMHKLLSSYSDSQLAFLLDVMSKTIELTHEESKKLRQSMQGSSSL